MTPPSPADWRIASAAPLSDGIGGKVWRVELEDGTVAALKQASEAGRGDARRGADYLRWLDGGGAVRLLAESGDCVLLEWAGDKSLLDHFHALGDASATEIAAETVMRLHALRSAPCPASLRPLHEHFSNLFWRAEADRQEGLRSPYVEGAEIAERLLDTQRDVRPLHGDIHHDNILSSPRGWLAIDPKGLVGDPAFDVANMFCNPFRSETRLSESRAMAMAEIFACTLGRDMETVLSFALAYSRLSTAWNEDMDDPKSAQETLAIGRVLAAALAQVRS